MMSSSPYLDKIITLYEPIHRPVGSQSTRYDTLLDHMSLA